MECQLVRGKRDKRAGSVSRDTPVATDQSEMSYWEVCEQSRGWWEGRGHLQAPSDEPDLVPATGNARVLVRGHHEGIGAEVVRHAQDLPQQADLAAHRLLRGRPIERPVGQSESTASVSQLLAAKPCVILTCINFNLYLFIFWPLFRQGLIKKKKKIHIELLPGSKRNYYKRAFKQWIKVILEFNLFRWVCRDQQWVEAVTWRWFSLALCRGCGCQGQTAVEDWSETERAGKTSSPRLS